MIYFYSKTNQMHQFLKFILFGSSTLHISDGLSVHHQEPKTVHTASGACRADSAETACWSERDGTGCNQFLAVIPKCLILETILLPRMYDCILTLPYILVKIHIPIDIAFF